MRVLFFVLHWRRQTAGQLVGQAPWLSLVELLFCSSLRAAAGALLVVQPLLLLRLSVALLLLSWSRPRTAAVPRSAAISLGSAASASPCSGRQRLPA